jgi:uncharacterized protein (DUF1015 family)
MVRIHPFAAVRPQPNLAARVACPPYDVVTTEQARAIAAEHAESFMRVVRSEVDLPPGTPPYDPAVYARARANFDALIQRRWMVRDTAPHLYLYRQVLDHRSQTGLVCCCHAEEYQSGLIKRHELTRPDKEDDRTRHVLALNANAGPVFMAFRDQAHVARLMDEERADRPLYHFNAPDGVTHTVWTVGRTEPLVEALARVPALYIADGHHRAASAARAAAQRRAANPRHRGDEEYNWFLAALFPAAELRIFPYNRLVRDLHGLTPARFRQELARVGRVSEGEASRHSAAGSVDVYLEGVWRRVSFDPATIDRADPIRSLDVDLLQQRVLAPLLGIGDPRTDQRIEFVGGPHSRDQMRRRVDAGEAAVAFALHPTTMDQLMAVADAGLVMPPKSTWFEPKLRSGLLVHELGDA